MISHDRAVMISDLHVGDGDLEAGLDKFDRDQDFERLLLDVIPRQVGWPATLIIGGDFIDFPQIHPSFGLHDQGDKFGVTEVQSMLKMQKVIDGHRTVFASLSHFLERGGQVLVLPGNHDVDLYWDSVFALFRREVGGHPEPQLCFVKDGKIDEKGIYIEHGNQRGSDNRFTYWPHPIVVDSAGVARLERPWGTLFMDLCYNEAEGIYHFLNKVHPLGKLLQIAFPSGFLSRTRLSLAAQVVFFFLQKGKLSLVNQMLGEEQRSSRPAIDAVHTWLAKMDPQLTTGQREQIVAGALTLLRSELGPPAVPPLLGEGQDDTGLPDGRSFLGEADDEKGLYELARGLLVQETVTVVAGGHTHRPLDVQPFSDERRYFNTGSWIPHLPSHIWPRWDELDTYPYVHDIRYLVIELTDPPRARLERL